MYARPDHSTRIPPALLPNPLRATERGLLNNENNTLATDTVRENIHARLKVNNSRGALEEPHYHRTPEIEQHPRYPPDNRVQRELRRPEAQQQHSQPPQPEPQRHLQPQQQRHAEHLERTYQPEYVPTENYYYNNDPRVPGDENAGGGGVRGLVVPQTTTPLPETWCSRLIHPQEQCGGLTPQEYIIRILKRAFRVRDMDKPPAMKFKDSSFCRCFMAEEEAEKTKNRVVDQALRLNMKGLVMFPPLLLRSHEDKIFQLDSDFIVVCCRNGAVIPVVHQDSLEFYRKILNAMYLTPPFSNLNADNFLNLVQKHVREN